MAKHRKALPAGQGIEENLKKAVSEMLILQLFSEKERYIGTISKELNERSNGALTIVFPYAAVYRLQDRGYLKESEKRIADDGRKRQYYAITKDGLKFLQELKKSYFSFTSGIASVLGDGTTK